MKKIILRFYDLLFRVLPFIALALVVVLLFIMALYFPPVIITLTLFAVYALIDLAIWFIKRELEKCPADAPEAQTLRTVLLLLHVAAIVVLGGIAVGFFRLMFESMERRGFGIWEMVEVSFAGALLGLLLVLRRRRNNKKEKEND